MKNRTWPYWFDDKVKFSRKALSEAIKKREENTAPYVMLLPEEAALLKKTLALLISKREQEKEKYYHEMHLKEQELAEWKKRFHLVMIQRDK